MIWKITRALKYPVSSCKFFLKKIASKNLIIIDKEISIPFDGQVYLGNPSKSGIARSIFQTGYWEYFASQKFKYMIGRSECVVDVGAAGGYFSLIASKRAAFVIAFEPIPEQRILLKRNLEANKAENCKVFEYALMEKNSSTILTKPGVKSRISLSQRIPNEDGGDLLVECRPFDELKRTHLFPKIDVVKIDIEGAEYHALKGMYKTLIEDSPKLLIELHPGLFSAFGFKSIEIFQFLESLKYRIYPVDVSNQKMNGVRNGMVFENIVIYCEKTQ
jgi:FkbM family methyltransferase